MESRLNKIKENFADKFEFPKDIVLGLPKITITGENEIIIENHKGIVQFEDNIVRVNSEIGLISIHGKNFSILFIGGETITISGLFKSLVYEGNEKTEL